MHLVEEVNANGERIYPYRCSRCGGCFLCEHKQIGYEFWVCRDGYHKPTTPDPGVPVPGERLSHLWKGA